MIKVKNLCKAYGSLLAVQDLSFEVKPGEIFGLLGPNGAGKSTTLGIIDTSINPDEGSIIIDGINKDEERKKYQESLGSVPQEIALYNDLSAMENLMFWGKAYGMSGALLAERCTEVLMMVGLLDRKNDKVGSFSGGMKRRINLACSVLHRPKVLLMDEATAGVDPQSRNHIFQLVEELSDQGLAIIYTSHYMEEIERLCHRIAIMDCGKILVDAYKNELLHNGGKELELQLTDSEINTISSINNYQCTVYRKEKKAIFKLKSLETDLPNILSALNSNGIESSSMIIKSRNLESLFLDLTGKELRD